MKHLLSIEELDRGDIERILRPRRVVRRGRRAARSRRSPRCAGARSLNLFYEASTRTSSSLRARRQAPVAPTWSNFRSARLLGRQGRVAEGHRPDAVAPTIPRRSSSARPCAGAAQLVRAGRRPRSSTPATASTSTRRRRCSTSTRCAAGSATLDGARIWIVGDVLHSRVARSQHHRLRTHGREGDGRGPADAHPARHRGAGLRGALHARRPAARPTSSTRCACSTSA